MLEVEGLAGLVGGDVEADDAGEVEAHTLINNIINNHEENDDDNNDDAGEVEAHTEVGLFGGQGPLVLQGLGQDIQGQSCTTTRSLHGLFHYLIYLQKKYFL